jgi:carotenoid cleavage dioxygenase
MRWFTTDACYVLHPMNAWEEGDKIFADVMEYAAPPLFPNADGSMGERANARLVRWTFNLAGNSDTVKREQIDDLAGEFPRFDERRAGLAYRHGWFAGVTAHPGGMISRFDTISHIDVASGRRTDHVFDAGDSPGEPVFVPRSADAPEGDGWLVTVVYRRESDRSDFVVYDARNVGAGPIAAAELPRRVPFGFHGNWRKA